MSRPGLSSLGLAAALAAGVLVTTPAPGLAASTSCRSSGAGKTIVKRGGSGVVYTQDGGPAGTIYIACSTRYGKRVDIGHDASELVDEAFTVETLRISGRYATMVYRKDFDTGSERATIRADLKTGRATRRHEEVEPE